MRINSLLGIALVLASGTAAKCEDFTLVVYLQNTATTDFMTLTFAKGVTARIFAGIGVRLRWEMGAPRQAGHAAIAVQFDSSALERFRGDAFAYATPFDESHTSIHIFYDRVMGSVSKKIAPKLLGHVMAHEIGHVLERTDAHAATGVMKAHWNANDYGKMAVRPLPFTADDIESIRAFWGAGHAIASR